MKYHSHSQEETIEFGKTIAANLKSGDILLLLGDLGAGKTTLVKGIAERLGIENTITSPTFTLMNVYPLKKSQNSIHQLVHIDTYRLESEEELRAIGAKDYIDDPRSVSIIEWPEKLQALFQDTQTKKVVFQTTDDPNERIIEVR